MTDELEKKLLDAEQHLTGKEQGKWLDYFDSVFDETILLLEKLFNGHETARGLYLSGALAKYWWMRGHAKQGLEWVEKFLEQEKHIPKPQESKGEDKGDKQQLSKSLAKALKGAGSLAHAVGDYTGQLEYYTGSLKLLQNLLDDKTQECEVLNTVGMAHREMGNLEEAEKFSRQSNEGYTKLGNKWGQAHSLNNIGVVLWFKGDCPQEAVTTHQKVLELRREIGDTRGIASSLGNLGNLKLFDLGEYKESLQLHKEALQLREQLGDKWGIAGSNVSLGTLAIKMSDLPEALARLNASADGFAAVGDKMGLCEVLEGYSLYLSEVGEPTLCCKAMGCAAKWRDELNVKLPIPRKRFVEAAMHTILNIHKPTTEEVDKWKAEGAKVEPGVLCDLVKVQTSQQPVEGKEKRPRPEPQASEDPNDEGDEAKAADPPSKRRRK
eukprot:TRINITY_DN68074_c6_g2_i1.p1 TRINITY_DN68074_c6_g2~~TRINITY_DN68074_c6_g2_i1.p1  ORF type:complete len:438 (-),score=64.68 TRINITY_DN68074_c6_g2_i1:104-1417(-)